MSFYLFPRFVLKPTDRAVRRYCGRTPLVSAFALLALAACNAQTPDLTQKSLEELMNVEVVSVAKKQEKLSRTAAAVFVISRDDIRRSGALNIPDLLRMVPGMDVAQIDTDKWAVSVRGFNGQYSNKLLVLMDGRTVYNPIFAGVYWDSEMVPLDTILRIEVIRGPGAAVWGANAVNGVINIITRNALDTQGGFVTAGGGNIGADPEEIEYGGKAANLGAYRIYAAGLHETPLPDTSGPDHGHGWTLIHGGFRSDMKLSGKDSLMTEGEAYSGSAGESSTVPVSVFPPQNATLTLRDRYSGWSVLSRWDRTATARAATSFQVFFDRFTRGDSTYGIGLNTVDLSFQQNFAWTARQDLVWGVGYRLNSDDTVSTLRISFMPEDRRTQLFSGFLQDEIAIRPDRISLSVGARLEHNDYTGFGFQPSARLVWTPEQRDTFWAAVSGADRTPARVDVDIRDNFAALTGPGGVPMLIAYGGNPNEKNERLTAFEGGYRRTWSDRLSVDSAVFYNRYRHLSSAEPQAPRLETSPGPPYLLVESLFGNRLYGETHGIEVFGTWRVADFWTLSPGYSWFNMQLHRSARSQDTTTLPDWEGGSPDHQAQLRSSMSLPGHMNWNTSAYFVNRLPAQEVPSYTRLDSGLSWNAGERLSFGIYGQNLLRNRHLEYAGPDDTVNSALVRRDAYVKMAWSF